MDRACLVVVQEAQELCPVDNGPLKAAIFHKVRLENGRVTGVVGDSMEYAPFVHQGTGIYAVDGNGRQTPWGYYVESGRYAGFHWTHGQRPNPFLAKAITNCKDEVRALIAGV